MREAVRLRLPPAPRRAPPAARRSRRQSSASGSSRMRLFWLEDPMPAELQEGFRIIREHTTTPIAVGEVFNSIWDCRVPDREQLIDYIRDERHTPAASATCGRSRPRGDAPRPHGLPRRNRPLPDTAWPQPAPRRRRSRTSAIQEYMLHTEETNEVFPHSYYFERRISPPGRRTGARRATSTRRPPRSYPYRRAYLPINRLEDGTMHSW